MRVKTDELARQADELHSMAYRLNDIQDTVLRITRNLSLESVGEKFRPKLQLAARAIGERSDELRRMRVALNQIAQLYERCEMTVLDEADHAVVHHDHRVIRGVRIPDGIHPWGDRRPGIGPNLDLEEAFRGGISWEPFDL